LTLAKSVTRVMAINMTYDGNIALAAPGIVALFDRDLNMLGYVGFPGEAVDNGVSVDESGIYVVTSEKGIIRANRLEACGGSP
jgi:hypothetical protein